MRASAFLLIVSSALCCMAAERALEIPFRWTPGQIEVQVSIDGRPPIWCILDSGAEFSMLDAEVAKTLKLGPGVRRGGRERIENVTLAIGPVRMRGQSMTLWSLDNFRRQKREIRGVVGCELFERYAVTIDYQRQVVIVTEPPSFHPNPNATEFPITFAGRLPVIRTSLKIGPNVIPARLMIDTGASQAVILRYPFANEHQLFGAQDKTTTSETVATGPTPFVTLSVDELRLGRWRFPDPRVKAYGTQRGAGGGTSTDGLLGNDILHHFRVTFDYSRKRLLLEETDG